MADWYFFLVDLLHVSVSFLSSFQEVEFQASNSCMDDVVAL